MRTIKAVFIATILVIIIAVSMFIGMALAWEHTNSGEGSFNTAITDSVQA